MSASGSGAVDFTEGAISVEPSGCRLSHEASATQHTVNRTVCAFIICSILIIRRLGVMFVRMFVGITRPGEERMHELGNKKRTLMHPRKACRRNNYLRLEIPLCATQVAADGLKSYIHSHASPPASKLASGIG